MRFRRTPTCLLVDERDWRRVSRRYDRGVINAIGVPLREARHGGLDIEM
jgi:hypothetical protein